MTTTNNVWMPASGRHPVNVGPSLARVLKARTGSPAAKRSTLVEREFYSFRYNFKPESIDTSKPGFIDAEQGKDTNSVAVERSSTQAGEYHLFNGSEKAAKEWECVLIYDEETGTFTLEKLESFMTLTYDKKSNTSSFNRSTPSASPAPPRPSPSTKSKSEHGRGPHAEREIGEDDDVQLISPPRMQSGAVDGVHPSRPFQPKPVKPSKASTKPHDQSSLSQPGLLGSRPKTKLKKHTTASDVEEEELNFGQPARPAKRRRRVSGTGLALPSTSAAVRDVQNLATSSREGIKNRVNLDVTSPSPPPVVAGADSESEEEWSEVETRPPAVAVATGTDSEGEDMDDLEAEMKRGFEELDKHSAAATPEPGIPNDQPISLHERASMNAAEPAQDYDDITSSEEESDSD